MERHCFITILPKVSLQMTMLYDLDNERGFYEPGFLHLRINTEKELVNFNEILKNDKELFSTFFHEYIHFLQEITTPSGVMNSFHYIDFLKDIIGRIRAADGFEFKVPIKPDNTANIVANQQLRKIYAGDFRSTRYTRYDSFIQETEVVSDRDGKAYNVKKYKVFYYDLQTYASKTAYFGHTCLKEFVTHTLQKQFFPLIEHDDFPYTIASQVMEREYPEFGNDPLHLVAYCDACLMFSHPAQLFFTLIEKMREKEFVPQKSADVYNFVYNTDIQFSGPMGKHDFSTLLFESFSLAMSQFADALKSNIFDSNRDWIFHMLLQGFRLRLERPHFITELVIGEGTFSPLFYQILHNIGTPFFTDKKWKGGFVPPTNLTVIPNQPYQLLGFQQFLTYLLVNVSVYFTSFAKRSRIGTSQTIIAQLHRGFGQQKRNFAHLANSGKLGA